MTRSEARLIAEELYKLIRKDLPKMVEKAMVEETEEYFDTKQAADFLGVSIHYVYKNIDVIPHTKIGKLNKFKKSSLMAYRSRR